eukprot:8166505-Pyramimonas_sp.AAC.1
MQDPSRRAPPEGYVRGWEQSGRRGQRGGPSQRNADDRTGSSRGYRDQWSYDRSSDRRATHPRDDAWRRQEMRTGNDGIFNHGVWAPFSKNPLSTNEPKKSDGSNVYKAPLRAIDSQHS